MIFVYRAAIVAFATFVSALAGFAVHSVLPVAYVAESKGMVGLVVGLVASLLSLVLSLLIWTSCRPVHCPAIAKLRDDRQFDHPPQLRAQSLWPRGRARARASARSCRAHTRATVVQPG